eukprot:scaffold1839_cov382-Prasinococcus_capsulatus_cf.AAC.12
MKGRPPPARPGRAGGESVWVFVRSALVAGIWGAGPPMGWRASSSAPHPATRPPVRPSPVAEGPGPPAPPGEIGGTFG